MKKLISIGASLILAVSVFAAGTLGVNPPQNGSVVFTPAGGLVMTTSFAYPFQTAPLMQLYSSATNVSYTSTTTNFVVTSVGAGGATNYSVAWSAFVGGTKMAFGSVITGAGTNVIVTFPFAYAAAPIVTVTGNSTNVSSTVGIQYITTTNFAVLTSANSTNQWISVGTVYNPQTEYQGQNPLSNKILTP